MRAVDASSVDPIKEFRLRNWARRNYVSAAVRGPHWHPIVLEEMRRRDGELTVEATASHAGGSHNAIAPRF